MDPRRRDELKKQMQERYPLIPDAVVASSIDVTADAFARLAPEKLQVALRPGGMARAQPELEGALVDAALRSGLLSNVPLLDEKSQRQCVEVVVAASLNYLLQDARQVLAAPESRLAALEEQVREVKRMMGPARLLMYRARRRAREIGVAAAFSATAFLVYRKRSHPMVAKGLSILSSIVGHLFGLFSTLRLRWGQSRWPAAGQATRRAFAK